MHTNAIQMKNSKQERYSLNYSKDQSPQRQDQSKSKKRKPDYSQQRQQKRGE